MNLQAKNLTFKYFQNSSKPVLEDVNLCVPENKITILTGKSGSGKSTLAYILAGLYPENAGVLLSGTVTFGDENIHDLTPDKRVAYVSMMFQNPDLQFCMNNLTNELAFCLENLGVKEEEREERIQRAAKKLKITHLLKKNFQEMSGGEKQKCALCCIFILESKCIILDEAFANIDVQSAKEIIALLKEMKITVLAIDHQLSLWEGDYDSILSLDGSLQVQPISPDLPLVENTILTVENLIVNGIDYPSMCFQKGSLTAIWGKSGCGKTTFLQTLIGKYSYKGEILLQGKRLSKIKKKELFSTCGIVFQNPANQFLALTVFDEVLFSVKRWYQEKDTQWQQKKTQELLDVFQLGKYKKYSPYLLSQGQQRRLAVLSMIAGEQSLLLLDEPTYGQDGENIQAIMTLLVEKAKEGLTVIFSTHNESVAKYFSHQIIRLGEHDLE